MAKEVFDIESKALEAGLSGCKVTSFRIRSNDSDLSLWIEWESRYQNQTLNGRRRCFWDELKDLQDLDWVCMIDFTFHALH